MLNAVDWRTADDVDSLILSYLSIPSSVRCNLGQPLRSEDLSSINDVDVASKRKRGSSQKKDAKKAEKEKNGEKRRTPRSPWTPRRQRRTATRTRRTRLVTSMDER